MIRGYNPRKTNIRKEGIVFLIVCEGQKTERVYFGRYRERKSKLIVYTPNSAVTDPENLVKFALNQIKKYDIDFENGDQVWCVFDADRNTNENIDKAKKLASEHKVNLCLSNPCFELWYLLHFFYFDQKILTADLLSKLNEYLPNYDKTKDCFDVLLSRRNLAIKHAEKLNQKHIESNIQLLTVQSNPSTQVVNLVKEMLKVIKQNKEKDF